MPQQTPFQEKAVRVAYNAFPEAQRALLLELRELVFACAGETAGVGLITETLKWGEPAYLTEKPKSGTTIRLGLAKNGSAAIFTHCQTTVISEFQAMFLDDFLYDGNRAVYVSQLGDEATNKLRLLITRALTYHC